MSEVLTTSCAVAVSVMTEAVALEPVTVNLSGGAVKDPIPKFPLILTAFVLGFLTKFAEPPNTPLLLN